MNADELRAKYRELIEKQKHGTFTQEDAAPLLAVCSLLAELGYILNGDESDWYKRHTPTLHEN